MGSSTRSSHTGRRNGRTEVQGDEVARASEGNEQLLCSFCGKSQRQVKKLIAGPGVYICDECIDLCNEIIDEELTAPAQLDLDNLPRPKDIYSVLNDYVVSQEEAKRTLAVAVYNHYKRVQMAVEQDDVELQKSNILEATVASVPPKGGRKHPHQEFPSIDTTNILFICGGAFADLEKIISKRIGKHAMGFGAEIRSKNSYEASEMLSKVMPEDLLSYGLIPEFIGRLPVISAVHQLQQEDLVQILTEPKNALVRQYQRFFAYDSIELVFTEEALWQIAEKALERETGARGLRSIIEGALLDVMFELPSRKDVVKCAITKETIEKGIKPTLVTTAGADDEAEELAEESA